MQNIKQELDILKLKIDNSFVDPIPNSYLHNFVLSGSKYIRSSLVILYLKSQGIEITEDVYKILVAGELIHNASLLHDDVLDNAQERRGKTTISKMFTSKFSILAGDFLLTSAIDNLLELKSFEILNNFKICIQKMVEAEVQQFFLRNELPTEDEYLNICKGKTAELFSCILESCAQVVDVDCLIAKKFANIFGVCFQIKNDLQIDSAFVDIENGILTAKDILGIENTNNLLDNYKQEMKNLIKDFPNNIYKESLKDLIESL